MWKQLSSKQIFKHPRITLVEDKVQLQDGTITSYLTFADVHDSVVIICKKDEKILISQQYSYPMNEDLYEFAGGKIEPNEVPLDAAKRELQEETAYIGDDIQEIGWYYVNNRRSKSKMYVFLATNPKLGNKIKGDIEEQISTTWIAEPEIQRMIRDRQIVNYSALAAWSIYRVNSDEF